MSAMEGGIFGETVPYNKEKDVFFLHILKEHIILFDEPISKVLALSC